MKKVYGTYTNSAEGREAIDKLLEKGYKDDEIKVISSSDLGKDGNGLWEKIKDAFTLEKYDSNYWDQDLTSKERKHLEAYKTNLQNGEFIILVEEGSAAFREYFKDGVPDWDEREKEFNEDLD